MSGHTDGGTIQGAQELHLRAILFLNFPEC
jgi:hypothetical protein